MPDPVSQPELPETHACRDAFRDLQIVILSRLLQTEVVR